MEINGFTNGGEESSVVAAASKSTKFWIERGGFKTTIINTEKLGHTHFIFKVEAHKLLHFFNFTLKKNSLKLPKILPLI